MEPLSRPTLYSGHLEENLYRYVGVNVFTLFYKPDHLSALEKIMRNNEMVYLTKNLNKKMIGLTPANIRRACHGQTV
jgi:hypothetical protein